MAPRSKTSKAPTNVRQKKLDTFLSSSPSAPSRSPARAQRSKTKRRPPTHQDDDRGRTRIPTEEESSQSSDAGAIHFAPEVVVVSDSEDDIPQPTPSKSSLRGKKRARAESVGSCSDDSSGLAYARKSKRLMERASNVSVSDEEDEEPPRKRGKLVKGARPPTPDQDDDDLLAEVDERRTSTYCFHPMPWHTHIVMRRHYRVPIENSRQAF